MKAGWFDIGWKGHDKCMPIEKKSLNTALGRTSAYHKRYTCSGCGLSDKFGKDHKIGTCQHHLKQGRPVILAKDILAGEYKLV